MHATRLASPSFDELASQPGRGNGGAELPGVAWTVEKADRSQPGRAGQWHGAGTLVRPDGQIVRGTFERGRLVKGETFNRRRD